MSNRKITWAEYNAPDKGGTCFNDWGVNKIEVYFK